MCLEYHCGHGKEVSNPHAFQDDPGTRRRPRRSCRLQRQLDQRWLGYERLDRLGRGRSLCSLSVSGCSARVTCAGAKTRSLPTRVVARPAAFVLTAYTLERAGPSSSATVRQNSSMGIGLRKYAAKSVAPVAG